MTHLTSNGSRRTFIQLVPVAGVLLMTGSARAQTLVDEKDPAAVSLGYVADAAKVNKAKYTSYAAGQRCGTCALYQGAANSAAGPCPIFAGKQVASKAWCSAYTKKA